MNYFDIDSILGKADLLSYVERSGGKLRGGGGRYSSHCSLHGGDNPTALSIFQTNGKWLWKCWTGDCNDGQEASDAISFVMKWQGFVETDRNGRRLSAFQQACEWISGGMLDDSEAMRESAQRRHEKAQRDLEAAQMREKARRDELRRENRHLYYHKTMTNFHKEQWIKAGIDEGMQEFWYLGGSSDFKYMSDGAEFHSPTLTIPIFNEDKELMTIQHRLLSPHNPKDKYRPEKSGLHAHPFLALPEIGFDGDMILVMEGAKKAMVSWTRLESYNQCIGVWSQEGYKAMTEKLMPVGRRVIVIPDPNTDSNPNALKKAWTLAKAVGGRYMQVPMSVDDFILSANIDSNRFYRMLKQSRTA